MVSRRDIRLVSVVKTHQKLLPVSMMRFEAKSLGIKVTKTLVFEKLNVRKGERCRNMKLNVIYVFRER
jgi:hypothetical protein